MRDWSEACGDPRAYNNSNESESTTNVSARVCLVRKPFCLRVECRMDPGGRIDLGVGRGKRDDKKSSPQESAGDTATNGMSSCYQKQRVTRNDRTSED